MKIMIIVVILIATITMCACAQEEHSGRYQLYTLKSGNNDLTLLLDSATGKAWQASVDATGKVNNLFAITVEG